METTSPGEIYSSFKTGIFNFNKLIFCSLFLLSQFAVSQVKVADVSYSEFDVPLYTINAVTDFGADPSGSTDATSAIQAALNSAESAYGGIVYLPEGEYLIKSKLVIPGSVTLRGDWKKPTDTNKSVEGTVLLIDFDAGLLDGNAISLGRDTEEVGACIRDLSIYYPQQTLTSPSNPTPYPYTLEGVAEFSTILNITLVNAYQGIRFIPYDGNSVEFPTIKNVYGAPIYRGTYIHNTVATPRTLNLNLEPEYWAESGLGSVSTEDVVTAMRTVQGIGINSGDGDGGGVFVGIRLSGYRIGLQTFDSSSPRMFDFEITDCLIGIDLPYTKDHGWVITGGLVQAEETAVKLRKKFVHAQFNNVTFQSDGMLIDHRKGTVGFTKCTFQNWGAGHYAIESTGGWLSVTGSEFMQSGDHIDLSSNVERVVIYGNTPSGSSLDINNNSSGSQNEIVIDNSSTHDFVDIDAITYEFENHKQALNLPDGTSHVFDVKNYGAAGDGVNDDTDAFQDALDAAGNLATSSTGCLVFVPVGVYRINGRLTVPSNVELRGIHDAPFNGEGRSILCSFADKDAPSNPAFITLDDDSGISGLFFYRPEQTWNALTGETTVHSYPPAVRGTDRNWAYNINLGNMYDGIDFSQGGGHELEFIYGCSINEVVKLRGDGALSVLDNFQCKSDAFRKARKISLPAWEATGFGDGAPNSDEDEGLAEMGTGLVMYGDGNFRFMGHFVNRSGVSLYRVEGSPTANFYICGGEGAGTGYYIYSDDGMDMDMEMVSNSYHTWGEGFTVSETGSGDIIHAINSKNYGEVLINHIIRGSGHMVLQQEYRGGIHDYSMNLTGSTSAVIEGGFFDGDAQYRVRARNSSQVKICGALTRMNDWDFHSNDDDNICIESISPDVIIGITGQNGTYCGGNARVAGEKERLPELLLYPIPVQDQVTIQVDGLEGVLEITDLSGRLLRKIPIASHTSQLDLSTLNSGVYLLNFNGDEGYHREVKIIKK